MKTSSRVFLQILVLLAILAPVGGFWWFRQHQNPQAQEALPKPVRVVIPQRGDLERWVKASGILASENQVTLVPKVSGSVESLLVKVGDAVGIGMPVADIEREAYALDLRRAQAAQTQAASTWERIDRLYKTGNATRQDWEDARAARDATDAQASSAQMRYDWSRLTSPIDGVVLVRHVNEGALVAPEARTPVYTLGSLDALEVTLNIPSGRYEEFSQGVEAVRLIPASSPSIVLEAQVNTISPWVNPKTRSFEVVCSFANSDDLLRPGMLMDAQITLSTEYGVLMVEEEVLVNGNALWVVREGRAQKIVLDEVEIHQGALKLPDSFDQLQVVVEGQHFLREGEEVSILEEQIL